VDLPQSLESSLTLGDAMNPSIFPTVALATLIGAGTAFAESTGDNTYPQYPPYCSNNESMRGRSIPPLDTNNPLVLTGGALNILHVTSVIRHGARTPTDAHKCWYGYTDDWDCDIRTLMALPTMDDVLANDDMTQFDGQGEQLIFEKSYDASESQTSDALGNILGGTCQKGQLLKAGYAQQYKNGSILKKAYVHDPDQSLNTKSDVNHMLFSFDTNAQLSPEKRAYTGSNLYFRSDDYQRTLMSGQVLLQSLFESLIKKRDPETETFNPVVRVHTKDGNTDTLTPNHKVCPRLNELMSDALTSMEYQKEFVESEESIKLRNMLDDNLDGSEMESPGVAIDCLMTAICNKRKLPDVLNDYVPQSTEGNSKYGNDRFKQVADNAMRRKAFVYSYQQAAYAKLAMAPIWYDILSNIIPHTSTDTDELRKTWPNLRYPAPKFALFSGHDTTIRGLLISLDLEMDLNIWPPYASMFLIELYSISTVHLSPAVKIKVISKFPSSIAFRMIYNGEVITHMMPLCDEELCDINNLIVQLPDNSDILQWENDCKVKTKPSAPKSVTNGPVHAGGMSTLSVVCLCIISVMLGGIFTYCQMERYWRDYNARNREVISMELGPEEADACGSARVYGVVPASNAIL